MAPPPSSRAPSSRIRAATSPFAFPPRTSNVLPSMKMLSLSDRLASAFCAPAGFDTAAPAASATAKTAAMLSDFRFSMAIGSSWRRPLRQTERLRPAYDWWISKTSRTRRTDHLGSPRPFTFAAREEPSLFLRGGRAPDFLEGLLQLEVDVVRVIEPAVGALAIIPVARRIRIIEPAVGPLAIVPIARRIRIVEPAVGPLAIIPVARRIRIVQSAVGPLAIVPVARRIRIIEPAVGPLAIVPVARRIRIIEPAVGPLAIIPVARRIRIIEPAVGPLAIVPVARRIRIIEPAVGALTIVPVARRIRIVQPAVGPLAIVPVARRIRIVQPAVGSLAVVTGIVHAISALTLVRHVGEVGPQMVERGVVEHGAQPSELRIAQSAVGLLAIVQSAVRLLAIVQSAVRALAII